MLNLSIKLISVIFVIGICSTALAGRHGNKAITHLDTDGDGLVSFDEFRPRNDKASRMLEHADLDDDGAITLDEMQQARDQKAADKKQEMEARMAAKAEKMAQTFLEMDTDDSGSVTPEEIRQHMFNEIDDNQDGHLSADEFNQHMQEMRRHHGQSGHRRGGWDDHQG